MVIVMGEYVDHVKIVLPRATPIWISMSTVSNQALGGEGKNYVVEHRLRVSL